MGWFGYIPRETHEELEESFQRLARAYRENEVCEDFMVALGITGISGRCENEVHSFDIQYSFSDMKAAFSQMGLSLSIVQNIPRGSDLTHVRGHLRHPHRHRNLEEPSLAIKEPEKAEATEKEKATD